MTFAGDVWNAVSDPLAQAITQRAFAEVVLLGLVGGALGCWVVFYGLSYGAESLAHGLFPGLVLASLTGIPVLVGGAAGLIVAALAIALARRVPEVGSDTAVAIVVSSLVGLGALLALSPASPPGIQSLLFGDILGVSDLDLALAGGLALALIVALRLLHGGLLVVGFDRQSARMLGADPRLVDIALLVLVTLAILVGIQGLGNLLVVAVLVAPAASARLLVHRVVPMMALSMALAIAAGAGGLYLSYYAGTAAGASIVAVMVAQYLAALGWTARRGHPFIPATE